MKTSLWSYRLCLRRKMKKKPTLPKDEERQNSSCLLMGNLAIGLGLSFPTIREINFVMQV